MCGLILGNRLKDLKIVISVVRFFVAWLVTEILSIRTVN